MVEWMLSWASVFWSVKRILISLAALARQTSLPVTEIQLKLAQTKMPQGSMILGRYKSKGRNHVLRTQSHSLTSFWLCFPWCRLFSEKLSPGKGQRSCRLHPLSLVDPKSFSFLIVSTKVPELFHWTDMGHVLVPGLIMWSVGIMYCWVRAWGCTHTWIQGRISPTWNT